MLTSTQWIACVAASASASDSAVLVREGRTPDHYIVTYARQTGLTLSDQVCRSKLRRLLAFALRRVVELNGFQADADGTRRVKVHMIGAASAQAGVAIGDVLIRIVRAPRVCAATRASDAVARIPSRARAHHMASVARHAGLDGRQAATRRLHQDDSGGGAARRDNVFASGSAS